MTNARKVGEIVNTAGDGLWEVYQESDGTVTVEKDALNGSEDDTYACLSDLKESLATGYSYRSTVKEVSEV